jgi:hypothetical protein
MNLFYHIFILYILYLTNICLSNQFDYDVLNGEEIDMDVVSDPIFFSTAYGDFLRELETNITDPSIQPTLSPTDSTSSTIKFVYITGIFLGIILGIFSFLLIIYLIKKYCCKSSKDETDEYFFGLSMHNKYQPFQDIDEI